MTTAPSIPTSQPDPATRRQEFWSLPEDALVDRPTTAAVAYLKSETLESLAIKGGGPAYTRIGRRALYRKKDVLAWLSTNGQRVENTSQLSAAA